jgi:hypothetical protein
MFIRSPRQGFSFPPIPRYAPARSCGRANLGWVSIGKPLLDHPGVGAVFGGRRDQPDVRGRHAVSSDGAVDRGQEPGGGAFNGPYYLAEQLGFRKVIDTTFMIAAMIKGTVDPGRRQAYFRALRRAQRDIDLRPELYTHYYKNEFPERFHAVMDTRSWGPGERIVFETYSKEVFEQSFDWIAEHEIFAAGRWDPANTTDRPSRLRRSRTLSTLPENAPCESKSWLVCSQPSVLDGGLPRHRVRRRSRSADRAADRRAGPARQAA